MRSEDWKRRPQLIAFFCTFMVACSSLGVSGQTKLRQMEKLSRGIVAVVQPDNNIFIGWRMFGTDPENIAFNLYRKTDAGKVLRLNAAPITDVTYFIDEKADRTRTNTYFVRPVLNKKEQLQAEHLR